MKKYFAVLCMLCLAVAAGSCKKEGFSGFAYAGMMAENKADSWLQTDVLDDNGKKVMWFQLFDQVDKKDSIESYKSSEQKVGKYPADVNENKWIWMVVADRFEIRLIAEDKSSFANTQKLTEFLMAFDFAAMEKAPAEKMTPEQMKAFLPKFQ
jgi:hypothetical protein